MVAIAATNSTTPTLQAQLLATRERAARKEAETAQAEAESLRSQADRAELESSQLNVSARIQQMRGTYSRRAAVPSEGLAPSAQEFLVSLFESTQAERQAHGRTLKTDPSAPPVVNARGEATGRIVNLVA
ncbi:MAG: hypothetical protein FGM55_11350 [Rhodoferax sp.]|nr:hypothetical protein [Rhodoferax sp.]